MPFVNREAFLWKGWQHGRIESGFECRCDSHGFGSDCDHSEEVEKMNVKEKMLDAQALAENLLKMQKLDNTAFAEMCGRIIQFQRDQEQIETLKAELEKLKAKRSLAV